MATRETPASREVIQILRRAATHLSATEIFARARAQLPRVGLATIYRALKKLTHEALITSNQFHGHETCYELATEKQHHDHLICESCGRVEEFADAQIEALQQLVARRHQFALSHHRLDLFGICQLCQGKNKKPENKRAR